MPTHTRHCHEELRRESSNGQGLCAEGDHLRSLVSSALPLDKKATVVLLDTDLTSKGCRLGGGRAMNMTDGRDPHPPAEGAVTISQSDHQNSRMGRGEDLSTNMLRRVDKKASVGAMRVLCALASLTIAGIKCLTEIICEAETEIKAEVKKVSCRGRLTRRERGSLHASELNVKSVESRPRCALS
jgi:hypothetical protein